MKKLMIVAAVAILALSGFLSADEPARNVKAGELLNVSDNQGQKLWQELNDRFTAHYIKDNGRSLHIQQSSGDQQTQTGTVLAKKLEADVVTLGLGADVDSLRRGGLLAADWEYRLPHRSVPFTSPIVILVPKGNPLHIKDWPDLAKPEVQLLSTDPKSSRTARYGFLAAWGSVLQRGGSEADAHALVTKLYQKATIRTAAPGDNGANVAPLLPKQNGEVLLTWEKEALEAAQANEGQLEVVYPPISILGEPQVTIVDANVERHGSRTAAVAYLNFLFSEEAQEVIARNNYRPIRPIASKQAALPAIELFSVQDLFRDRYQGPEPFFAQGGIFDQIRRAVK
jgi:sulfate transport system substrate-binding protein